MNVPTESVRVTIFGQDYSIATDSDKETTRQIAAFVDKKMMELKRDYPSRENLKIAVLSALNIAGELYEYKDKCESMQQELHQLQQKLHQLTVKIDSCINEVSPQSGQQT